MPRKSGATKPVKVMETLQNAASLFQVPSMQLATNIGVPVNADIMMKKAATPERVRGLSRPSTIMCPW